MDQINSPNDAVQAFAKAHDMANTMFDQTSKAMKHQQTVQAALAGLSKLGDMVTSEDVIKAAGGLVAGGTHGASEMAQMLADLPQGGAGINAWVGAKLQSNQAAMEKLQKLHALTRHETVASGMRLLAARHGDQMQAPPEVAPVANQLTTPGVQ